MEGPSYIPHYYSSHLQKATDINRAITEESSNLRLIRLNLKKKNFMWCIARFGTICTIWKTWQTPMEEWTLLKVTLLHRCFWRFFKLYKWYQIAQRISYRKLLYTAGKAKTIFAQLLKSTHFLPPVSFFTPWKHQKTKGFLMFSECIERDQWHVKG